jgi:hypothetical protein
VASNRCNNYAIVLSCVGQWCGNEAEAGNEPFSLLYCSVLFVIFLNFALKMTATKWLCSATLHLSHNVKNHFFPNKIVKGNGHLNKS